ncbi:MAG: response regulator [Elusimicrobia bacterium]|nr:response regulator [Elusimicrobiota bacterium]
MPRLGGFGVLEEAADTRPRTPVIVMTGFGTVEMAVHAMRLGASDFLLSPSTPGSSSAAALSAIPSSAYPETNRTLHAGISALIRRSSFWRNEG